MSNSIPSDRHRPDPGRRKTDPAAEIERLQGELAALTNVLVGVLYETIATKPEVFERMKSDIEREIERIQGTVKEEPARAFRVEGAQRFYRRFLDQIAAAKTKIEDG